MGCSSGGSGGRQDVGRGGWALGTDLPRDERRASNGSKLGLMPVLDSAMGLMPMPESILVGVHGVRRGEKQVLLEGELLTDGAELAPSNVRLEKGYNFCPAPPDDDDCCLSLQAGTVSVALDLLPSTLLFMVCAAWCLLLVSGLWWDDLPSMLVLLRLSLWSRRSK